MQRQLPTPSCRVEDAGARRLFRVPWLNAPFRVTSSNAWASTAASMNGLRLVPSCRWIGLTLACLAAACSSPVIPGMMMSSEHSCENERLADLANVDWSRAPEVDIVIHKGEFTPAVVSLSEGHPYRMVVTNKDQADRVLNATAFFEVSGVYSINRKDQVTPGPCIAMVSLEPGASAEVKVVPRTPGRFNMDQTIVPIRYWGTGLGAIVVE